MTSIRYRPLRCSSQIRLRLANALTERGVCPAMYSRKICSTSTGAAEAAPGPISVISITSPFLTILSIGHQYRSSFATSPFVHVTLVAAFGSVVICVGLPALRDALLVVAQAGDACALFLDAGGQIGLLRLELGPQGRQLCLERGSQPGERPLLAVDLLLLCGLRGSLLGFLGQTRRSGEHAAGTHVDVHQLDTMVGQEKLADLVRVAHPARLE